jgi:hypothetical protein
MKMVAWKVFKFVTELEAFLRNAFVDIAWFGHAKQSNGAVLVTTSVTHYLFNGDVKTLCDPGP